MAQVLAMEDTVLSVQKRTKMLIEHVTSGLKERNEIMSLALLACISGENFSLYGPQGTGKNTMLKKVKSAFSARFPAKSKIFETPPDSAELAPTWEDFMFHLAVNPIQNEQAFLKLITSKKSDSEIVKSEQALSAQDLKKWDSQIEEIQIPHEIQSVLSTVRNKLLEKNYESEESEESETFYISDSRWIKIARILKTSAFLNGRKAVDFMDAELISHFIWKIKKHRPETETTIDEAKKLVQESILSCKTNFDSEISHIEALINEYKNFVESAFYIEENGAKIKSPALFGYTKPAEPNTFKMNDGTIAFRIMHPSEIRSYDYITPHYVSKDFYLYEEGKGAYFDQNKERIAKNDHYRDKYFVKNLTLVDGNAVWTDGDFKQEYSMRVQMIPENFVKGDEEKLAALKAQAEEKYTRAACAIEKAGGKIQKFIRRTERQYKANFFSPKATMAELLANFNHAAERVFKLSKNLEEIKL